MVQRTLIAYQTKTGVTAEYASIIAGVLSGEFGHQVDIVDLKQAKVPELTLYDNIIIGSGIRIGRLYGRSKKLFKDRRLADKNVAVFMSSGEAGEADDPSQVTAKYERKIRDKYSHFRPVSCIALGGAYPNKYEKMDWRDPEGCREWANKLGETLKYS
jgi:menaquinone-dependent protoporphyrinogen oxidase